MVRRPGGPDALVLEERPDPSPGPGEVLVRVRAIGLNFADCMARLGVYPNTPRPPFVPGMEVAGEVCGHGAGVTEPALGTRVAAVPIFGGHAEQVTVPVSHVTPLPEHLAWDAGAAVAVTGLTADWALNVVGRVRAGERVLVTAAAGGVGTMLVQLARNAGARVLAVASTPAKRELAATLGAAATAGYDDWPLAADAWGGLDLVVDAVGGAIVRRAWRRLAGDGRYVLYGFAAASGPRRVRWLRAAREWLAMGLVHPMTLVSSCRTLAGFNLSLVPQLAAELRRRFAGLEAAMAAGVVKPVIGMRVGFSDLARAHAALQGRSTVGKVVVLLD